MGEFILIILAIVVSIISSVVKMQRKKAAEMINTSKAKNYNELPYERLSVPKSSIDYKSKEAHLSTMGDVVDRNVSKGSNSSIILEEDTSEDKIDFNLRDAVIYSEILKRKF